ncbi:hypothetical protein MCAP1_001078, partial [Malassezia caprae]
AMGQAVYSANDDDKKEKLTALSGDPSPVLSDTASVFSNGEIRVTRALEHALSELVTTERSYVARLDALYNRYAVPLQQLTKDKDTQIIPAAEADIIFGNVGEILAANKILLCELEVEYDQGPAQLASLVGDILCRHMHMFQCYVTYLSSLERAQQTYNQMLKHRAFRDFIERTQHSTSELGNVGLRELMMEPLQRIPRYQLLIGYLLKHMPPNSTQTQRLQDASAAATIIASRRATDGERLAAILWSCQRKIDRFPPELVSPHRELLGSIDVDELGVESPHTMIQTLHSVLGRRAKASYALLVFTDALVLVQRHSSQPTHQILGVQEPDRLADLMRTAHLGNMPTSRRSELSFAGMTDLLNVRAMGEGSNGIQLEFQRPLRGTNNRASLRHFSDAAPDARISHMAPFLDCFWRAQAVHRAQTRSLGVRQSFTQSVRGPLTLFWTLFTHSQYERFEQRDRCVMLVGSVEPPVRQAAERASEFCVTAELFDEADACRLYLSRSWGAQTRQIFASLDEIPRLCADMLESPTLPQLAPSRAATLSGVPSAASTVPVPRATPTRRAQSMRTNRPSVPTVHRARSLMSDRVRASIHSSLEAVQESEHSMDAEELPLGRKRAVPLAEVSNQVSPKRRAVPAQAAGAENVRTMPMHETPVKAKPVPADIDSDASMHDIDADTPSKSHGIISMYADDTLDLPNPFDERGSLTHPLPALPEPEKAAAPLESAMQPISEAAEPASADTTPTGGATEVAPVPPPKDAGQLREHPVSEDEMQELLRPLLEHIQEGPQSQPVVHVPSTPVGQACTAEIVLSPAEGAHLDASEASDNELVAPPPPTDTVGCAEMKAAIVNLNERIAALRRHRPRLQGAGWGDDWQAFKQAIKHVNVSWTKMERAYENNQMELASLRLAQPEHDERVHLSQEAYMELQDQLNALLPLRVEVETLTKRCAALQELEKDARMENAELYEAFNEELAKIYQTSFRPANDEIHYLREALQAAKAEVHALRTENRALRSHQALIDL